MENIKFEVKPSEHGTYYVFVDITDAFVKSFGKFFAEVQKVEYIFYLSYLEKPERIQTLVECAYESAQKDYFSFDGATLILSFCDGSQLKIENSEWGHLEKN